MIQDGDAIQAVKLRALLVPLDGIRRSAPLQLAGPGRPPCAIEEERATEEDLAVSDIVEELPQKLSVAGCRVSHRG